MVCQAELVDRQRRFCSRRCAKIRAKADARKRGASWTQASTYRKPTSLTCSHCAEQYTAVAWERGPARPNRYCSTSCEANAKAQRYTNCEHGTTRTATCPVCTFMARINRQSYWRDVIRVDPCAYCGEQPANGIDHIDPAARHTDRADHANWTACCKRCNELKNTLPLLLALPWLPVARDYHDLRRQLFTGGGQPLTTSQSGVGVAACEKK